MNRKIKLAQYDWTLNKRLYEKIDQVTLWTLKYKIKVKIFGCSGVCWSWAHK